MTGKASGDVFCRELFFLCAGARKEISSESCTRPARRVVEKSVPLLDFYHGKPRYFRKNLGLFY